MHAEWKMPVKLFFQWEVFKAIPSKTYVSFLKRVDHILRAARLCSNDPFCKSKSAAFTSSGGSTRQSSCCAAGSPCAGRCRQFDEHKTTNLCLLSALVLSTPVETC